MNGLELEIIPYSEIAHLSGLGRIRRILKSVKKDKIVLLQGRLRQEEETELIKTTMEEINKEFKGVELAVIQPEVENMDAIERAKMAIANYLIGDRQGLTIVGPATIVKEIKKDPHKISLLMKKSRRKKK
ncbi:DUF2073 domain-containing protein [Candidatus Woesearchaeota archaeon]|jgi:hypothetical protein|nr:MAG: DUF2073 domain-containing protein [Candidatus Woesearchaeota archaeon]